VVPAAIQLHLLEQRLRRTQNLATIRDPFKLTQRALELEGGHALPPHDQDDAHAYLLEKLLTLADRYNPAKDAHPNFGAYALTILRRRVTDWKRETYGDTRYHNARTHEPLTDHDAAHLDVLPETLDMIHIETLTPTSRHVYEAVLKPHILEGATIKEIATWAGRSTRSVRDDLNRLGEELRHQWQAA
jgi:DNA-directed RNA polymerase specialized sigma24 family protein